MKQYECRIILFLFVHPLSTFLCVTPIIISPRSEKFVAKGEVFFLLLIIDALDDVPIERETYF